MNLRFRSNAKMALRQQFSLIHSEFNEFLYASVGDEKTGSELTVLSALARLGFDPWAEAARLSKLPAEAAAVTLAAAIARLPEGDWKVSDLGSIAVRLVDRLPRPDTPALSSPRAEPAGGENKKSVAAISVICLALAIVALLAMWHLQSDPYPKPASSTSAPAQR